VNICEVAHAAAYPTIIEGKRSGRDHFGPRRDALRGDAVGLRRFALSSGVEVETEFSSGWVLRTACVSIARSWSLEGGCGLTYDFGGVVIPQRTKDKLQFIGRRASVTSSLLICRGLAIEAARPDPLRLGVPPTSPTTAATTYRMIVAYVSERVCTRSGRLH